MFLITYDRDRVTYSKIQN